MEEEIQSIIADMHAMFNAAEGPRTRQEYMREHGVSGRNWHFGLSAEDIIENKIPANVIGCTGRAKLFCYLAAQKGIKASVVCTAKYDDWKAVRDGKKDSIMSGHQIIAVKIGDKLRVFDPGRKDLVFIDTKLKSGEFIDAIGVGKREYIVTAVVPGDKFEEMNTYQKLSNLYTSGDMNNPEFTIRPRTPESFNRAEKSLRGRILSMVKRLIPAREDK